MAPRGVGGPRSPARPAVVAALGSASGLVPAFLVAALAVQLQADLRFSSTQLGFTTGAFFVAAGLSAVVGGQIADRVGWRSATLVATTCSAMGLVGVAALARSWGTLLAALALAAAGNAVAQPASNLVLAREVDDGRLGLAFGIKQASVPLATLVAGGSVPTIAARFGWRAAFVVALVLPVLAGGLALGHTGTPPALPAAPAGSGRPRGAGPWIFGAALAAAQVGALNTFTVVTAVESGMSQGAAGTLLAGVSLVGLASRVLLGWSLDLRPTQPVRLVARLLAVGALGCATMSIGTPVAIVAGLLLAVVGGWGWGGIFLFAVVQRYPAAPASATGAIQAGISLGLGSGPLAFGAVFDASGPRTAWLATAALTAVAAAWMLRVGQAEASSPQARAHTQS